MKGKNVERWPTYVLDYIKETKEEDMYEACDQISDSLSALASSIYGLNEAVWQGAIDEVRSRIPGEPEQDEDFSRDFSTSPDDARSDYDEMFTSLLESSKE